MSWRRSVGFSVALGWLLLVILAALLAPSTPPSPNLLQTTTPPFQAGHWLGTDPVGYDVLASLLGGARSALLISLPAALFTNVLGGLLGVLAGFFGNTHLRLLRGWVFPKKPAKTPSRPPSTLVNNAAGKLMSRAERAPPNRLDSTS